MQKEVRALEENGTWTLEELPDNKRLIDFKGVYKAWLVAKCFTQLEGIDFHETFTPVSMFVTVRSLLAFTIKKDQIIHQLDVKNACFHGGLDEEV